MNQSDIDRQLDLAKRRCYAAINRSWVTAHIDFDVKMNIIVGKAAYNFLKLKQRLNIND